MGGGSWIVQEGYLLCKHDGPPPPVSGGGPGARPPHWKPPTRSTGGLAERYAVLTMNRKLEFFDHSDVATRTKVDTAYVQGFGGWDGNGLLKVDSYGLELKVERNAHARMHLAALNRVDLEKWCRGFMAVLDPRSAAGEEVRRERRRVKKEEKRLQEEYEEKVRKWKENKAKKLQEEQDRLLAREEEINNMTPLERVDGLGSLDEDTARMLEKRKLRLQRRQAPTMGRVNKAAYRRRLEEAAGGKTDNVQPLHTKLVEQKTKVRVELPPPGQFIEMGGIMHSNEPLRLGSSGSDLSDSSSISSRLSSSQSASSTAGAVNGNAMVNAPPPPPPPPRWSTSSSRMSMSSRASMHIPPPPPPPFSDRPSFHEGETRLSRSGSSFRRSSFDSPVFDREEEDSVASRSSFSQSRRRLSNLDGNKHNAQDNLAAILGGGRPKSASRASRTSRRRDSFGSTISSATTASRVPDREPKTSTKRSIGGNKAAAPEPSMANAFAASLAAIRRNRADTVEEMSTSSSVMSPVASTPVNGKVRNRKRDSQLSAEGKEIWKKAMGDDAAQGTSVKTKTAPSTGRKGLFDDSSSEEEEDSDSGLFGVNGRNARATSRALGASNGARSSDMSADMRPVAQNKNGHAMEASSGEDDSSDSDDDNGTSFFAQVPKKEATSPKSSGPSSVGAGGSQPSVTVFFTSSAVRNEGKKSSGVFTFTLQFGNLEHSFSFTYTDFEEVHTRLASVFSATALPKFPSKHRLRNNTKPENLQKRAQEFRLYLQQLVAVPGMLSSERFQFEYHIDGAFARSLANGQTSSGNAGNGTQPSGRPPRSPATPPRKERATASPAHSQQKSPPARATRPQPTKGGLFGSDDSDSDPESDSDTSVDTPKPMVRQQRRESAASTASRRKPKASQFSSSSIASAVPENGQRQKPSRARSRTSSRASSKASYKAAPRPAEPPRPAVTGLPPGRPNPFAGGRGDLLAAIRQGAQLKKTDGASDANSSGEGVSGGSSTGAKAPPHPPALTEPGSINEAITNAMAARRIHVEYEETNSNAESDSDDDWD